MAYRIIFYRAGMKIGSIPWHFTFDQAKEHASQHIKVYMDDGIEITDDRGLVLYRRPSPGSGRCSRNRPGPAAGSGLSRVETSV